MTQKILFVDDNPNILKGIKRQLEDFQLETAIGPNEALRMIEEEGPFAVVISDMRMPAMTGIELLKMIRERSPDTIRMILTGFSDLPSTIEASKDGNVFRFLSKPCEPNLLENSVRDAMEQHSLSVPRGN